MIDWNGDLRQAVRQIEQLTRQIAAQEKLLAKLRLNGRDTELAERVLKALEEALTTAQGHREFIRQKIAKGGASD